MPPKTDSAPEAKTVDLTLTPDAAVPAVSPTAPPANPGGYRGGDRRGSGGRGQGGQGRGRGGSGGNRGQRGGRGGNRDESKPELTEKVVFINRCAKVVKGGRRFSFSALIVVGDRKGKVGVGFGKANEVTEAIRKATDAARKHLEPIALKQNTIPHEVLGSAGGGRVFLRPASPGTGIIAGGGVRAVVEAAGIKDILAKSLGSSNHANVVHATLGALKQLRPIEEIFQLRGKTLRKPGVPSGTPSPVAESGDVVADGKGELRGDNRVKAGRKGADQKLKPQLKEKSKESKPAAEASAASPIVQP